MGKEGNAEKVVRDIRRRTRRRFSAEEKVRIVLEGLRGEQSIAELCRREGLAPNLYYRWHRQLNASDASRRPNDPASLGAGHLGPDAERTLPEHAVVGCAEQMPTHPEQILDDAVDRQEPLRLPG